MKKNDLKKLALMGLTGGLLFTMHSQASAEGYWRQQSARSSYQQGESGDRRMMPQRQHQNNTQNSHSQMTEQELLSQLNQQGRALYQSLGKEGKTLALQLANQTCEGQNECDGLNSCRGDENDCAGEGNCAGTSKGPFKDKNQAVEAAAKHLAKEREKASKNMLNNGMDRIPKNRTSQRKSWLRRGL